MTGRRPTPTSTTRRDRGKRRAARLSGAQITGGGLAALTAAVTASYLGVTGTVIGAAVMSVATTVGTEFYAHLLRRTGHRVKQHTVPSRRTRPARHDTPAGGDAPAQAGDDPAGHEARADEDPVCDAPAGGGLIGGGPVGEGQADGTSVVEPAAGGGGWSHGLRGRLGWLRVGAVLALVFTVSFGGVLIYQAFSGQMAADQGDGTSAKKAGTGKRHGPDRGRRAARRPQPYLPMQSGPPATPSPTGPSGSPAAVTASPTGPAIGTTTGPDGGTADGAGGDLEEGAGIGGDGGTGGAVNGTAAPPDGSASGASAPPPGSSTAAPLEAPEAALPDTMPSASTAPGRPHTGNSPAPTRPSGEDTGNRHR
ncbi:hypothetical protein AB0M50_34350 [Nonomuraea fuscirosea]|uniref:hypothetical protein n=1 Tax=Nonomuraea fuscirosea TaxID=1291556 RepID=UPI00343F5026